VPSWDDVSPMIDEAIAALPEECRLAVIRRFLEGRAHKEIASELGLSHATVRRRIGDGVERIRKNLAGRGIVVGAGGLLAMLEAAPASALPAALVRELGKRSLAPAPAAAGATAIATVKTGAILGGAIIMKKAVVVVAVLIVASAFIAYQAVQPDTPVA